MRQFQKSFTRLILLAWTIPAVFGLAFIVFIKVLTFDQILGILATPLEPVYIFGWLIFAHFYFKKYIKPLTDYLDNPTENDDQKGQNCMRGFTLHFWGIFLVYLLLAPASVIFSAEIYTNYIAQPIDWFRIHLVALIIAIIVGLPIYFNIIDLFGKVIGRFKLKKPHITIKTKVFLIGSLTPLLIDTMIVQYYWTRTGFFTFETFMVWLLLEILAIAGSLVFVKSFAQSLSPLEKLISSPDQLNNEALELDLFFPGSTDELGVITQKYKDALERITKNEKKYQQLIDNIPDIVYRTDNEGRITFISPSVKYITGYTADEALGMKVAEEIYAEPEERRELLEHLQKYGSIENFEARLKRKDGSIWWGSAKARLLKNQDGVAEGVEGIVRDVSQRKSDEETLSYQATHDALTGIVNRREFERRANRLLATIQNSDDEHALCFMDLDQFKLINDTCGHNAGDELLRQLSHELQGAVRKRDTLARLGGDEFGVILEHCSLDKAEQIANAFRQNIQDFQFSWEGQPFRVSTSIGLVAIDETTTNFTELMKQVDAACYMAKDLGRNRIHTYRPDDSDLAQRHGEMQWVARINQALEENRFCLYAQAIVPLDSSTDQHYELLLRMLDDQGGIIAPGAFLPAAERYGLIEKIDAWVIKNAFNLLAAHPAFAKQINFISINLSGPSLTNGNFLDSIISQLKATGIEPGKICFEVTETVAISNLNAAITFIEVLKHVGCRFALDDFGSGLSSFGYLKKLPVDYLKIDGMFVKGIVDDPVDRAMVKSINDVGQVMGMQTIGEFVENDEIKRVLKDIGVTYGQGYGIERPRPFDELLTLVKDTEGQTSS